MAAWCDRHETGAPGTAATLPPDADHPRLRPLPPELRERRHPAAPADRAGAARTRGHDVSRLRRLPRQPAPPAGRPGRRPTTTGSPCGGSSRRPGSTGPTSGTTTTPRPPSELPSAPRRSTPRRRAPALAAGPWRRARRGRQGRSGAATVVTMHDFWWALRAPVPRRPRLAAPAASWSTPASAPARSSASASTAAPRGSRPHLEAADLVLAPSRSAAVVLEANGVPADRLRVDENGMTEPEPCRCPSGARARRRARRSTFATRVGAIR